MEAAFNVFFMLAAIIVMVMVPLLMQPPSSGRSAGRDLVGARGRATTDLRPYGAVLIGDERIDAVSEAEQIGMGTSVEVIRSDGHRHVVRPVVRMGHRRPDPILPAC